MQRFSWQAYQIAAGRFQTWIDRGRPAPLHREWADYLNWVAKSVIRAGHVELVEGNVSQISIANDAWSLSLENQSNPRLFQGLVITGTGDAKQNIEVDPKVANRVLDGRTFWSKLPDFAQADQEPTSGRIDVTIIGSGETAGSVAAALTRLNTRVTIISKDGIIFSRGETFQENALYSKPDEWQKYSHQFRKEFINRTDRGVFSQKVKLDVDRCERIGYEAGRVRLLHAREDGARQIVYETETSETETSIKKREFDWVVIATGFNPMSFTRLLDDNTRARLLETVGQLTGDSVAKTIDRHLCVGGLQPRASSAHAGRLCPRPGLSQPELPGNLV
jgi:mycobactin lysine-N-oxygenase